MLRIITAEYWQDLRAFSRRKKNYLKWWGSCVNSSVLYWSFTGQLSAICDLWHFKSSPANCQSCFHHFPWNGVFLRSNEGRSGGVELKPPLSTPGVTRLPAESGFKSNTRQIAVYQHRLAGKRCAEVRKESVIFKKNTHGTHFLFTLTTVPVRK